MLRSDGWYQWNWNPVVGCKRGCSYCYARREVNIKGGNFNVPQFFPERLDEPLKVKNQIIFVGAYCDLFGEWINPYWIESILETVRKSVNIFVFLTKNPKRYFDFDFPANVYLGVTIESQDQLWRRDVLKDVKSLKLCSIEPIMGDFTGVDLSVFDQVVVGYMIYKQKTIEDKRWLKSVKHSNLYIIQR